MDNIPTARPGGTSTYTGAAPSNTPSGTNPMLDLKNPTTVAIWVSLALGVSGAGFAGYHTLKNMRANRASRRPY